MLGKIQRYLFILTIVPLRLITTTICLLIVNSLAWITLIGVGEDYKTLPLSGWKKKFIAPIMCGMSRAAFFCCGFHKVRVTGVRASVREAPILVLAPHFSAVFDILPVVCLGGVNVVTHQVNCNVPVLNHIVKATRPILVCSTDKDHKIKTTQEITRRATSKDGWPQVLIFPQGNSSFNSRLPAFKCGAFYPGLPVQPICIKYPYKKANTAKKPGRLVREMSLCWATITQFHSTCEIEYLPVYTPNKEEKADPALFASNVRQVMCKALEIPVSDSGNDVVINGMHSLKIHDI